MMTYSEWQSCANMLSERFPAMSESVWNSTRFRRKFEHVPQRLMLAAIDEYIDTHNTPPTVKALSDMLPKGYGVKYAKDTHAHAWIDMGGAVMCDCGKHNRQQCQCEMCTCPHENAYQDSDHHEEWWFCPDCNAAFKKQSASGNRNLMAMGSDSVPF